MHMPTYSHGTTTPRHTQHGGQRIGEGGWGEGRQVYRHELGREWSGWGTCDGHVEVVQHRTGRHLHRHHNIMQNRDQLELIGIELWDG